QTLGARSLPRPGGPSCTLTHRGRRFHLAARPLGSACRRLLRSLMLRPWPRRAASRLPGHAPCSRWRSGARAVPLGATGCVIVDSHWIVCRYPATAPNLAFLGLGRSRVFTGLSSVREDVPSPDRELLFAYNDSFRGGGDARPPPDLLKHAALNPLVSGSLRASAPVRFAGRPRSPRPRGH